MAESCSRQRCAVDAGPREQAQLSCDAGAGVQQGCKQSPEAEAHLSACRWPRAAHVEVKKLIAFMLSADSNLCGL